MKKLIVLILTLLFGMIFTLSACSQSNDDIIVTIEDGFVYVNGVNTNVSVKTEDSNKSAFEIWKEENPDYTGTQKDWEDWLTQLVTPTPPTMTTYNLINNGKFNGRTASGSAQTVNNQLKMNDAVLQLQESVVLPLGTQSNWEINISGTLLDNNSGGAQLLVGSPFSEQGRVYLGVNKSSRLLYWGVRMGTLYINYGWEFDDVSTFETDNDYILSYQDGIYYLSVNNGEKRTMSTVNYNQLNSNWLEYAQKDSQTLNSLIATVTGQQFVELTSIGVDGFKSNATLGNLNVTTSPCEGYKRLASHPLGGTNIFYLGSSITYGWASNGVSFADLISSVSLNKYTKEAVSGTTLVDNGSSSYVQRLKNGAFDFSQNPDFLVVQLSTNDFSQNKPLGVVEEGTDPQDFDTSTISGAIQYIIAYAKQQCPEIKVVFYVGAVKNNWGYKSAYKNYVNGDFKTICDKWDITPLDILHTNYQNYPCFFKDDIHPTLEGYAAGWTPLFVEFFQQLTYTQQSNK